MGALEHLPRAQDRAFWYPVWLSGSTRPLEGGLDSAVTVEEAVPHSPPCGPQRPLSLDTRKASRGQHGRVRVTYESHVQTRFSSVTRENTAVQLTPT